MILDLNSKISTYAATLLSMYLKLPEDKPFTAVDFRAHDGELLKILTDKAKDNRHLYVVDDNINNFLDMRRSEIFEKVIHSHYKVESKISEEAFSLAIVHPTISSEVQSEMFDAVSDDVFIEPDYEKIERERLEKENEINFGLLDLTEEEKKKKEEEFNKKLEKAVKERKLAFRKALRQQERRIAFYRTDNFLLAKATRALMPGGILVMITPKELIDTAITIRLANQYEDIRVLALPEEDYQKSRKCIILAKKKKEKSEQDRSEGYLLAETKLTPYKDLEALTPQATPLYEVPEQENEAVRHFRIGPITAGEVLESLKKSNLLETYQETYTQSFFDEKPIAPTPLHKGHIMLLLTSGMLNGYIGKGENQHLVKGSVIKMKRETTERDSNDTETIKERDYYHISVKYLNNKGEFHKLM